MTAKIDHNTPVLSVLTPADADDYRRVIVANALWCVGLSAGDPETIARFRDLLGPPPLHGAWPIGEKFRLVESPTGRTEQQGVDTWGLVAEGIQRRSGIDNQWLREPYCPDQPYRSIVRTKMFAKKHKAWHDASMQTVAIPGPNAGCMLVVGCKTDQEADGGTERALTVVGWDGDTLLSVESGASDGKGLPCVIRRSWLWHLRAGHLWLSEPDDHLTGRRVVGWMDPVLAPKLPTCLVPEGWDQP